MRNQKLIPMTVAAGCVYVRVFCWQFSVLTPVWFLLSLGSGSSLTSCGRIFASFVGIVRLCLLPGSALRLVDDVTMVVPSLVISALSPYRCNPIPMSCFVYDDNFYGPQMIRDHRSQLTLTPLEQYDAIESMR
jgi:hypothetical protein